jgi:hypothetical protein
VVFRRRLRALYDREPEKMATFMGHFRDRAAAELDGFTAEQIDDRFLGWIDNPPHRRRGLRSI